MSIEMTPGRTICGRHGELFRVNWPDGYAAFGVIILEAVLCDPGYMATHKRRRKTFKRQNPKMPEDQLDWFTIHKCLDIRPACCTVPRQTLYEVYQEVQTKVRPWPVAPCELCGKRAPGSRYRRTPPRGTPAGIRAPDWQHVCIACVALGDDHPATWSDG